MRSDSAQSSARIVYAASSGEYSDYHVDCVFEREEDAKRYVAAGLADRYEELTLYSEMPTLYTIYSARINKVGGGYWGQAGAFREWSHITTQEPKHKPTEIEWYFEAEGPDRERVIKSVRDRYAAWKAHQEHVA